MKLPLILARDIASVAELDGPHYVFLLTFTSGEQIILKAEKGIGDDRAVQTHNFGVRVMGIVSAVAAETLTEGEVNQLGAISDGITDWFWKAELEVRDRQAAWVKAAKQTNFDGLADARAYQKGGVGKDRFEVNQQKKDELITKMTLLDVKLRNNRAAWSELGQICAVDCLLGNGDRISLGSWMAGDDDNPAQLSQGFVNNMGNLIFRWKGDKIVGAIGLDTFDPNAMGERGGYVGDLYNMSPSAHITWANDFGVHLMYPSLAGSSMAKAMSRMVNVFKSDFGITSSWGAREAKYFGEGFAEGARRLQQNFGKDLKSKLSSKTGPGASGIPPVLIQRAQHLDWI